MVTAIVSAYTPEGFVMGADGLRREGCTRTVVSEKARKIFCTETGNAVLSYAWAGATNLFGSEEKSIFDFLQESAEAARTLASAHVVQFRDYVNRFGEIVYQRLLFANEGNKLEGNVNLLPKGEEIARILFVGYFRGVPYRAQSAICRRGAVLIGANLRELRQAPVDFNVFSGSRVMLEKFQRRLTDAPETLGQATALIRDYIQGCIDNRNQDKECEDIGGHIHIASITSRGFRWIIPPI